MYFSLAKTRHGTSAHARYRALLFALLQQMLGGYRSTSSSSLCKVPSLRGSSADVKFSKFFFFENVFSTCHSLKEVFIVTSIMAIFYFSDLFLKFFPAGSLPVRRRSFSTFLFFKTRLEKCVGLFSATTVPFTAIEYSCSRVRGGINAETGPHKQFSMNALRIPLSLSAWHSFNAFRSHKIFLFTCSLIRNPHRLKFIHWKCETIELLVFRYASFGRDGRERVVQNECPSHRTNLNVQDIVTVNVFRKECTLALQAASGFSRHIGTSSTSNHFEGHWFRKSRGILIRGWKVWAS